MDFAPHLNGDAARSALESHSDGLRLLFLPDENVLLRISQGGPNAKALASIGHCLLADEALTFTYVQPHKSGFGPYFASAGA